MATVVLVLMLFNNGVAAAIQTVPGYPTKAACTVAGQQYALSHSTQTQFVCIAGPRAP